MPGTQFRLISKAVAAAATPERLIAAGDFLLAQEIHIQAKPTNTGKMQVGDETGFSNGYELLIPTATANVPLVLRSGDGTNSLDPSAIWIRAAVNGEGVNALLVIK